jgi:hypothetical protein
MYAIGCFLYLIGLIAWTIGNVMFLAVVFRYSTAWFFGCLWVPFANWIYFFLYMRPTWKPMLIGTTGCAATLGGNWMMTIYAP